MQEFRLGDWLVQPELNQCVCGGKRVQIEPKVMDLLVYLAEHAGDVLHKERIIQAVWPNTFVSDEALTYSISELRKALSDDPKSPTVIQTIPRRGYRLIAPVSVCTARGDSNEELSSRIAQAGTPAGLPVAVVRRHKIRDGIWIAAAVLLTAATVALALAYFRIRPAEVTAVRSYILPPENSSVLLSNFSAGPVAVSPDGRRLAVVGRGAPGRSMLWVRPLNSLSAQLLAGTEGASEPFWSYDSRSIGFFAGEVLRKIDASGGPPQTLCEGLLPTPGGGSWNRDGIILFGTEFGVIHRVAAEGGVPIPVTKLDPSRKEISHRWPYFLPDGRHFLYFTTNTAMDEQSGAYIGSLDSEKPRFLLRTESNAIYAPPGYLLTVRDRTLMAYPFDAKQLKVTGDALPVVENVAVNMNGRRGAFSVSENAVVAYLGGAHGSQLIWFDRSGKQGEQLGEHASYKWPQISPDGQKVAVGIADPRTGNQDVWVYDVQRGMRTRLTFEDSQENIPIWSPDGSRIAFASDRTGRFDLYQKASSGVGRDELVVSSEGEKYPHSWSPDGRYIGYNRYDLKAGYRSWIVPLFGDRKPFAFFRSELVGGFQGFPAFSPDGRWLAYTSDESGRLEVFVAPFPTPSTKLQVSTAGGMVPRWRRDGGELFYLALDRKVMAAELTETNSSLKVSAVRPLFHARSVGPGDGPYDVSADGQRFLVNTVPEQAASAPITVVQNWTAGLKR